MQLSKTIQTHLGRIEKGLFSKSDVGAFTKLLTSKRFADDQRKVEINHLVDKSLRLVGEHYVVNQYHGNGHNCEVYYFKTPARITKEQTAFGVEWLNRRYIKTNGQPRALVSRELTATQFDIVRNVKRFEFIGVLMVLSPYADGPVQVLPIYRTYDTKGHHFDYAPMHWSAPIIMEGF